MALGLRVDELAADSALLAPFAEQQSPQIVMVHAITQPTTNSSGEDILHAEEELFRDEGFMAARIELVLVEDDPGVDGVSQHSGELAEGDWLRVERGRLARGEAEVRQLALQLWERVVARGVGLESPPDERPAIRVDRDGVDEVAVDLDFVVQVADLGAAVEAAPFGFVLHLDRDVAAVLLDRLRIEPVLEGLFEEGGVWVGAEAFRGRNDLHALTTESGLYLAGIVIVPEGSTPCVDEDVRDRLRVILDVLEEFAKRRPMRDVLCGTTALGELLDDVRAQLCRGSLGVLTLRRQRIAVIVNVHPSPKLLRRRDANVAKRVRRLLVGVSRGGTVSGTPEKML